MITRCFLTLALALPLCAQSPIDFKFLDKLADKARESSVIDLGPEQLKMLSGATGGDAKANLGEVAKALKSIHVRSYEFDKAGEYDMAEVRAFRDKVKSTGTWVSLVSVKERDGFTDILIEKDADGKAKGFLIVAAEPDELSIVRIDGPIDLSDLSRLGGLAGIPEMVGVPSQASPKSKPAAKPAPAKQEEEDDEEEDENVLAEAPALA